ncbi:MAG: response regulator transcription factor [Bacteroidetes bacterium]|nr:response regulator transcription factor [Bacteroidota bacterium]
MKKEILLYGLIGGLLIALLEFSKYRFIIIEHRWEIYGGIIAAAFTALGIYFGLKLTKKKEVVVVKEVRINSGEPFILNRKKLEDLGITEREHEILELIAQGLSNKEIGETLFIGENTVKTHSSRLFDKLNAKRRMEAVKIGRDLGLLSKL